MDTSKTTSQDAEQPAAPRDRLTIGRVMVLTAGVAIGLTVFRERKSLNPADIDWWRETATAVLIGLSLPGVLYTTRWRRSGATTGLGSLLWLTLSLGSLLMVPPIIGAAVLHKNELGSNSAGMCLYYALPLVSLWFVLAVILSGHAPNGKWSVQTGWSDWFGWRLGLVWSVLGVWLLVDFYREALFQ
jgi:hypothetical protein